MEPARSQPYLLQDPGRRAVGVSGEHGCPQGDGALFRGAHVLEGYVGAVELVLAQSAQVDGPVESLLHPDTGVGQAGAPVGDGRGGPDQHAHPGGDRSLHPQRPDAVPLGGNGDSQAPEVVERIRHHPLMPRRKHLGGGAGSPADMGRVGIVEPRLPSPPVGQGHLRGEEGVVASGGREDDRHEGGARRQPEPAAAAAPGAALKAGGARVDGVKGQFNLTGAAPVVFQRSAFPPKDPWVDSRSCRYGTRLPRTGSLPGRAPWPVRRIRPGGSRSG